MIRSSKFTSRLLAAVIAMCGVPVGAALVADGRVLGSGHNRRVQQGSAIRHGETDCLENIGRLHASVYRRSTMYTTLSPWPFRPGARTTSTRAVSDEIRHEMSTLRFPPFADRAKTLGAVASYLNPTERKVVWPATSTHEPVTDASGLSGPA